MLPGNSSSDSNSDATTVAQEPPVVVPFPFGAVMALILSCYGSGFLLYGTVLGGGYLASPLDTQGLLTCLLLPLTLPTLLFFLIR